MRTKEKFATIWKELEFWAALHDKPVWIVPRESDYCLSVIKPESHELPTGTAANLYNTNLEIIDSVKSSK